MEAISIYGTETSCRDDITGMDHKSRLNEYIQKLVETNKLNPALTVEMAEVLMIQSECILACLRGFLIFEGLKEEQTDIERTFGRHAL